MRDIQRALTRPALVSAEIGALALVGALGASAPGLDLFSGPGFAALALLASASLLSVVIGLLRRRRIGSLLLHAGLLCVLAAGAVRALFVSDAAVDLVEGETLPPMATWNAQRQGLLAEPFRVDQPVKLEAVRGRRYPAGDLRELSARLSVGEVAVNRRLDVGGRRLFLSQRFGPAALLEWSSGRREAVLLDGAARRAVARGPFGLRVHLRAQSERPDHLAAHVMRGAGLVYAGALRPGQTLALPGGAALTLHGTPMWVRLQGSRDPSSWLAGIGFVLLLAGAAVIFVLRPLAGHAGVAGAVAGAGVARPAVIWARAVLSILAALAAGFGSSCRRADADEARRLVMRYTEAVSEAYRRGDVSLVDDVVGPDEGRKLTGLIGVRLDMGLTLDARLLDLAVSGVDRAGDEQRIRARERWRYCDRRIGTGEQVGDASTDAYEMLYVFRRAGKTWRVDETRFVAPPQVGRTNLTWAMAQGTGVRP